MLTEREMECLLKQMTPLEQILKQAYEAGDDVTAPDFAKKEIYRANFSRSCAAYDWEHPLRKICGESFLTEGWESGEAERSAKKSRNRQHMTHEDYALGNGRNIQIVRHSRYAIPKMHDHEFIEMSYVLYGTCCHELEERNHGNTQRQQVNLKEGDLIIIPPGTRHQIEVLDESVIINILMNTHTFERVFLKDMPEYHLLYRFFWNIIFSDQHNSFLAFQTEDKEEIRGYMFQLIREYVSQEVYGEKICEHLLEILFLKLMACSQKTMFSSYLPAEMKKVAPMILYLQQNFSHATLEDTAEKFHYSTGSVSRIFKKYTGITVNHYLKRLRLQKALELLETTELPVQEVASAVGYEDISYFISQFKKKYGVTPLQYRKKSADAIK